MSHRLFIAILVLAWSATAQGDEPMPSPASYARCTPLSERFGVSADLRTGTTSVLRCTAGKLVGAALWSIPRFLPNAHAAPDGEQLVGMYEGVNLVPIDATPALVVIEIFARRGTHTAITLGELLDGKSVDALPRTESHRAFYSSFEFDNAGQLVLQTRFRGRVQIDLSSGHVVAPVGVAAVVRAPRPIDIDGRDGYWDVRAALTALVAEARYLRGPQQFCVVGYAEEAGSSYAEVLWETAHRFILWDAGRDAAAARSTLRYSRRDLSTDEDVVADEHAVGGSTYLVTRAWLAALQRDCKKFGKRYTIALPHRR